MVITKKLSFRKIFTPRTLFVFLFLVLFPFGQVISIGFIKPIDIVAACGAVYALFFSREKLSPFLYLRDFLLIALFSWVISVFVFARVEVFYGLLYLVRLFVYFYFANYMMGFVDSEKARKVLINSLIAVSMASAFFGWLQLLFIPDTRSLFALGWDDHFYRMIGTFLDPTFLGLIIVLGLINSIYRYIELRNIRDFVISVFLTISLAFTYSRASYLALIAGVFAILYLTKKIKYIFLLIPIFFGIVLLLPTSKNKILSFTRQFSIVARLDNYKTTLTIFNTSPVFGVGYDNLCLAKERIDGVINYASHACSGSDSSLLLILATTGVVGLMIFIFGVYRIIKNIKSNIYGNILLVSLGAIFVHSLFSNSLFYPWILGWIAVLLAASSG